MRKGDDYESHPNEARSWPEGHIPYPIENTEVRNGMEYYFWHDGDGDYWYASKCGLEFAREMEAAQRRKSQ